MGLDALLSSRGHGAGLVARLAERVQRAGIVFGGRPLPTFPKPHVISADVEQRWGAAAESLLRVFEEAGRALLSDRSLRAELGLPAAADELFTIDPGYSRLVVSSRFDMVWANDEVRLLELNADSPAMMTYTDELERIMLEMDWLGGLLRCHGACPAERTRAFYDAILAAYREWGGTREDPCIALVDWQGEMTAGELIHTAAHLERFGSPTIVCDPRELSLVKGRLHARGRQIDIVQRRVLFPDFIRRADELATLMSAYRGGGVCMVNPLRSYVVGNKTALAIVSQNLLGSSLADQKLVAEHLPHTEVVTREARERLLADRAQYVLKGAFGSGGKEVMIGQNVSPAEWTVAIDRALVKFSVVQRLQPIPRYGVPSLAADGTVELAPLYANWNPWVFGGRYAGGTTRVGWQPIVVISGGGGLLPSMKVRGRSPL